MTNWLLMNGQEVWDLWPVEQKTRSVDVIPRKNRTVLPRILKDQCVLFAMLENLRFYQVHVLVLDNFVHEFSETFTFSTFLIEMRSELDVTAKSNPMRPSNCCSTGNDSSPVYTLTRLC